jgi:glycosyltransferase involved in cell wall biosynthesis
MAELPLVTIGIPTYNRGAGYLRQTLDSALAQTYPRLEIVVSDNGSTDCTPQMMGDCHDPRVRYFRQDPPVRPNDNYNFCLAQARGDFFLLLQDDDQIDPDFATACLEAAGGRPEVGVVRTGVRVVDGEGRVLRELPNPAAGLTTPEFFLAWFTYRLTPYLCSTLFNTRRLREIGGFHSLKNLFQDMAAMVELAHRFGRADVLEVKASFRKHGGELTAAARVNDWCADSRYLLDLMCGLAPEYEALLRGPGNHFFFNLNLQRADGIRAPLQRYRTYWEVFRWFDFPYPPVRYLLDREPRTRRIKQAVKRAVRRVLPNAWAGEAGPAE